MTRQFIPYGPGWAMPFPAPYPALVRDGERAWSSGMLPVDGAGKVLHMGDVAAQARLIAGRIGPLLAQAGLGPDSVSRLVLYCASPDAVAEREVEAAFRDALATTPLIEFVPIPHFYYDGLLISVDVHCARAEAVVENALPGGGRARLMREPGTVVLNLAAPVASIGPALGGLLTLHRLAPDRLMSGWGIAPEPMLSAVPGQIAPRLPGFFSGALMPCYRRDDHAHLYLTFATEEIVLDEHREGGVRLHMARARDLAVLDARYLGGAGVAIDAQTRVVMDALAAVLATHGLGFGDVVKSTTFYAGRNSAEDLHGNMNVRNSYYATPGPASTGVPIARMADPGSKVRIELVLRPDAG
jgi:enamine deaminase RidA (YjgF/YER057c/UK114 family)